MLKAVLLLAAVSFSPILTYITPCINGSNEPQMRHILCYRETSNYTKVLPMTRVYVPTNCHTTLANCSDCNNSLASSGTPLHCHTTLTSRKPPASPRSRTAAVTQLVAVCSGSF
jgi:hypothetical protein